MRNRMAVLCWLMTVVGMVFPSVVQAAIENNPKKEYRLTEKHGPWMIMVGSFSNVDEMERKKDGLSAEEAARKLVHELREKKIPAYVFSQDDKMESIDTYDRLGNKEKRVFKAKHGMICVLAGNYEKVDDASAQATLAHVKKFRPKFLTDPNSGAIVRQTSGTKTGPFVGAFLTINPLLDPNNIVRQKVDSVTRSLNSGIEYPLVNLKHKYTLRIATFTGRAAITDMSSRNKSGNKYNSGREFTFDKTIRDSSDYGLARAGEDATQLTYALRSRNGITRSLGRDQFESYVYHDRFQSIVTVGGFDSPDDPEISRLGEIFMARYEPEEGEYKLKFKSLTLPSADLNSLPTQTWVFDQMPALIEVPKIK